MFLFEEMNALNDILNNASVNDEDFEMKMRLSCIYIAYIKRLSNLIVSNYENDIVNSKEFHRY